MPLFKSHKIQTGNVCLKVLFLILWFPFYLHGEEKEMQTRKPVAATAAKICPAQEGTKIPAAFIKTIAGTNVSLSAIIAQKPTVLIFYSGGWCPYCNLQLEQLQKIEKQLVNLGYQIVALSADRPEKLQETSQNKKINYRLFSDSAMNAAQALGIAFHVDDVTVDKYKKFGLDIEEASGEKHHLLPVPAAFVLKTDGTVVFAYVNPDYKVRVQPEVLLAAAKAALKKGSIIKKRKLKK